MGRTRDHASSGLTLSDSPGFSAALLERHHPRGHGGRLAPGLGGMARTVLISCPPEAQSCMPSLKMTRSQWMGPGRKLGEGFMGQGFPPPEKT